MEEKETCEYCEGEGVVTVEAPVYPGEPHYADIASVPCLCSSLLIEEIEEENYE